MSGPLLEAFRKFAAEPRRDQTDDVAGYYAALAAEGFHGEHLGDDLGVIVRANVRAILKRILDEGQDQDAQAIGDGLLSMFLFGVRVGREGL